MNRHDDPQHTLRRVGVLAIIAGGIDVLYMIYALANGSSYASELNIFAIIAGILLYRGSVTAARVCAHFSAFTLGMALGIAVLAPPVLLAIFPRDFLIALVTHDTAMAFPSVFLLLLELGATLALFAYANIALTTGAVTSLYGPKPPQPCWRSWSSLAGIAVSTAVVVLAGVLLNVFLNSETAHRAIQRARERVGPASATYSFQVTRLYITSDNSGTAVDAHVIAYNSRELRHIEVEWQE